MDLGNIAEALCAVVLIGALAAASLRDLATREIPNWCVALVAAARVPSVAMAAEPVAAAARAISGVACVCAFLIAVCALARRAFGSAGIGAGDVKLWSALGLWAGPVGGLALVGASCAIALAARATCAALRSARLRLGRGPGPRVGLAPPYTRICSAARAGSMPMAPSIAASAALVCLCGMC